jgi:hypothetical protein
MDNYRMVGCVCNEEDTHIKWMWLCEVPYSFSTAQISPVFYSSFSYFLSLFRVRVVNFRASRILPFSSKTTRKPDFLSTGNETSVADPDPEGSETFGRIRIRFGTERNVSYPDPTLDPKVFCKKEP